MVVFCCHVAVSVLCVFLTVLWAGLQLAIVAFPGTFSLTFITHVYAICGSGTISPNQFLYPTQYLFHHT